MTVQAAMALIERVANDRTWSAELAALEAGDPPAALARIRAEGFDVTAEELREAYLERYGGELTPDQLERVAAGVSIGNLFEPPGGGGDDDLGEPI